MIYVEVTAAELLEEIKEKSPQWLKKFITDLREEIRYPHTACGRSFIALYEEDRKKAETWYDAACQYLTSKDAAVLKALS